MALVMGPIVAVVPAAVQALALAQAPVTVLRFFPLIADQGIIAPGSVLQDAILQGDIQGGGILSTISITTKAVDIPRAVDSRMITPVDKNLLAMIPIIILTAIHTAISLSTSIGAFSTAANVIQISEVR